MLIFTKTE